MTPYKWFLFAVLTITACLPDDLASGQSDASAFVLPANCEQVDSSTTEYLYCSGAFTVGKAQALCPPNYAPPTEPISAALMTACDVSAKQQVENRFYAADVGSWGDPGAPLSRNSCKPMDRWLPTLRGCGAEQGATEFAATDCGGWPHGLVCQMSSGWSCPDGTLKTASNTNPQHGVVCRRNAP